MERERRRAEREAAAETKHIDAARRRADRQAKLDHIGAQQGEAEDRSQQVEERVGEFEALLSAVIAKTRPIEFRTLKRPTDFPSFDGHDLDRAEPRPLRETYMPKAPGFFARLLPGAGQRHAAAITDAESRYLAAVQDHEIREHNRQEQLAAGLSQHQAHRKRFEAEVEQQHLDIDAFEAGFDRGEASAIIRYFSLVLEQDVLPDGFPETFRVGYVPESKQLVAEHQLPTIDVVPTASQFRYVRARDVIEPSARPTSQVRSIYTGLIARLALRLVHVLFASDAAGRIDQIVLNGFVDTIDPATGKRITPCLLTVSVGRSAFSELDLARADPIPCLKGLHAQVSASPHELRPVRPIVDFDMVDPRFIDKPDVLAGLDQRANLAELSPSEFEALITNLFEKMGLETRLTQASRDGGVDCVAWDMRPVVGGKVVVQAKRYKNTVGVSAVRDLYGTVMNEGAAKGILVSTSGYGKATFDFAKNKPLELISGSNLLYLLEQHVGIRAKIEFPEEWADPVGAVETGSPLAAVPPQPATA